MKVTVRHATASGRLDELWTFSPASASVEGLVRFGAVSVPFVVRLCSIARPELGAHPIIRIDGQTWRVLPQRYVRKWPRGIETLAPIDCALTDEFPIGASLELICTPESVSEELERL